MSFPVTSHRHAFIRTTFLLAFIFLISAALFSAPVYADTSSSDAQSDSVPGIGEYIQLAYNDTNGMLTSEANSILYSSDGYIWIASYSGLTRYDSHRFITYGTDNDSILSDVSMRTLFEDSKGRLWIGSNDSGIFIWESGEFFKLDISPEIISNSIRAFTETPDGRIIAATTAGIAIIDDNGSDDITDFTFYPSTIDDLISSPVDALTCDQKGNVWAVTGHDIISFRVNSDCTDTPVYSLNEAWGRFALLDHECNCIYECSDGRILIGTSAYEMIELTPEGKSYHIRTFSTGECYTTNCIYEDSYGRVWICSDTGIGYLNGLKVVYAGETKCSYSIVDMTEDYEGNLWFASSREGILELVRGKFTSINTASGLANTTVNSTLVYDGYLFAATDEGLVVLDNTTHVPVEHPLVDALAGTRIRSLMEDSSGNLWICTYKTLGVVRYNDGEFVSINTNAGLPSEKVRIAYELNDGRMAIATNGGVAIIENDRVVKTYTESDGFVNPVILCLTQDNSGKIYCGSDGNGIYVIDTDDTVHNYSTIDGLPTDVILNTVYDERHDCIWISCGSHLAVLDSDGIRSLDYYGGGSGSIFDIKLLENEVWILATTSVTIAPYEHLLTGNGDCTVFTKDDGVFQITSNSRHFLSDNNILYIATSNGIITVDIENIYTNLTVPKGIINAITIDHETVIDNPTGTVVINSDVNNISIDFAAFGYVPGNYIIEYQLVGMDREPVTVNSNELTSRDYTNLSGGTYTFRVSIVSPAGVRSDEDIVLTIKKTLSFFEHPLGILFMMLIVGAVIFAVVQIYLNLKTARLRERQERYRSITESALRTISKTIDAKDSYTNGHSYRVAQYSRELAERMGWKGDALEDLYYTALVHDIGKIGIPDSILSKSGRLNEDEYKVIQQHPNIGYDILKEFNDIPDIGVGAKYHHERYDGEGYLEGLKGEEIPLVARIIAVADAYDAMSTPRVYRSALSEEEIRREIIEGAGSQFDPQVAQILLEMIADGVHFDS